MQRGRFEQVIRKSYAMSSGYGNEMRRAKRRRSLSIIAVCAAMFAAGTLLALILCSSLVVWMAKASLADAATQLISASDEMGDETARVLAGANASPFAFCSDPEIALLRDLAFKARLIKDVGRVRDGYLYCSGTLGRLPSPIQMPVPSLITERGFRVYADMLVMLSRNARATVVSAGEASAVMSPDAYFGFVAAPMSFTVSLVNRADHQTTGSWGMPLAIEPEDMLVPGDKLVGNVYHRSACSSNYPFCVVTSMTRASIIGLNWRLFWAFGVLGGAAGLSLCLLGLSLWRREQSLESRLRRAIRKSHLTVVYQPIVDISDGRVAGAEALVRWRNEQGNPVSAEVFVQLAEEKGFISEITRFVLRNVVHELGPLLRSREDLRVNINIAAPDIADPEFFVNLERRVSAAKLRPRQIGIELTERSTAERSLAIDAVARLRARGHVVSIDDFGTGYSSLSYLTELNVNIIKIDQAFTRTVCTEAITATIVPQIIAMARTLNLGLVIEGIETQQQVDYFRAMDGELFGQGRYFAHPMTAPEFIAWVARSTHA